MAHVYALRADHAHMAIDAGSGIPARTQLLGVQAHGHRVFATVCHKRGDVYPERGVAVGMSASQPAVDPHLGVGHGSVEVQVEFLSQQVLADMEVLAVPADGAPGQLGRIPFQLGSERPFHAPVVGQVERTPMAVVVTGASRPCGSSMRVPSGCRP